MIQLGKSSVGIFEKRGKTILNLWGTVIFKGKCRIGNGASISVRKDSILTLGNNFAITAKSSIICSGGANVEIGDNTLFSWDILVINNDFHNIFDIETDAIINKPEDIIIGKNVWIGCRSTILKGSVIPDNSIIAATSTVSGKIENENCIYSGLPVKILKENVYWKK
jgi:acetyltransferase-like isoleucine patch superfamily enzyme